MHCTILSWAAPGAIPAFDLMLEDRKRLFVDLLGWNIAPTESRYEIDQFDGEPATYLVAYDDAEPHLGSMRLLPSTGPHILADLFSGLCDGAPPCDPDTCEITRLCLPTRHGARRRLAIRHRLISAMVDHALVMGIRRMTGVVEASFLEQVLVMGWRAVPLGRPRRIDGALLGAFLIEIDRTTPDRLAANGIYTTGALRPQRRPASAAA
jgi:acyl-homoserine lactone synthase